MWESQQQTYHLGMVHTIHLWWFGGGVYNISHENRYEIHPAASMNHTMNQKSKTAMGSLSSNKKLKAFLGCEKWNQTPWAEAKRRKCCAGTSSGERGTWQRQSGLHLHRSHVWESCEKLGGKHKFLCLKDKFVAYVSIISWSSWPQSTDHIAANLINCENTWWPENYYQDTQQKMAQFSSMWTNLKKNSYFIPAILVF